MKGNTKKWIKRLTAAAAAACMALTGVMMTVWGEESQVVEGTAMGRYVETKLALPEGLVASGMTLLENGGIRILGKIYGEENSSGIGLWDSSDGGATWQQTAELPQEDEGYLVTAALAPDGSAAVVSFKMTEAESDMGAMEYRFSSVDSQGNVQTTDLGNIEENSSRIPNQLSFTNDGNLAGICYGGGAVLLDPATGEVTAQLTENNGEIISGAGTEVVLLTVDSQLLRYDGKTGEPLVRDEAWEEELFRNGASYHLLTSTGYPIVITADGEGRIYYCTENGIFAHLADGAAVEQVVDGELNVLSEPGRLFQNLAVADQTFYLLCLTGTGQTELLQYGFDPDVPSTPERELTVYSLEEDEGLRQVISQFQKEYPDTYVNYQVGMSGEEAVTVSDALRTLNTDILAGNGPDVLMLDGISVETYEEQGILADLTEIVENAARTDGLLENIALAYQREDGIYAVPTRFAIPVIVGDTELISSGGSLEDLAALARDQDSFIPWSALNLAETLYPVYAGGWEKEEGTIDQEKLARFVCGVKEIYDNYLSAASPEDQEALEVIWQLGAEATGIDDVEAASLSLVDGSCRVFTGALYNMSGYSSLTSINRVTGNTGLQALAGEETNVFEPLSVSGILNTARERERAEDFVAYLLSAEGNQTSWREGFSVNARVFGEELATPIYEDGSYSVFSSNNQTGETTELFYYWPSQEEQEALEELVKGLTVCGDTNQVMKDTVLDYTKRCLSGEMSPDEAVNAIMQALNLYLAE